MRIKTLGLLGGLIMAVLTLGGYYWLWTKSNSASVAGQPVPVVYQPIEIDSIKENAKSIVAGLENNASIPIPIPIEKMGRANPFAEIGQ